MQCLQELPLLRALRKAAWHVWRMREASARKSPMKMKIALRLLIGCALLAGCDTDRLAKLEKENADLKTKVEKEDVAVNYDLQAKCSKDARAWFNLNFSPRDINTTYLDYTNHYNKKLNACFIVVEYHFNLPPTSTWHSMLALWNVYENNQYGKFDEGHYYDFQNPGEDKPRVNNCLVYGTKCTREEEFNRLVGTYMDD